MTTVTILQDYICVSVSLSWKKAEIVGILKFCYLSKCEHCLDEQQLALQPSLQILCFWHHRIKRNCLTDYYPICFTSKNKLKIKRINGIVSFWPVSIPNRKLWEKGKCLSRPSVTWFSVGARKTTTKTDDDMFDFLRWNLFDDIFCLLSSTFLWFKAPIWY